MNKISKILLSIIAVFFLSGVAPLSGAIIAHGATIAELEAMIASLMAQLNALKGASSASSVPASLLSSGNLTVGSKGAAVTDLQNFLKMSTVTGYFGSLTKAALAKWQAANGVSPAAGYFGAITRAKLSVLSGGAAASVTSAVAVSATTTVVEPAVAATPTPTTIPSLPNPFESDLKIEMTYQSTTLSNYGERTLAAFRVVSSEKTAITKIRFKNNGTFNNIYLTNFKLLENSDSGTIIAEVSAPKAGIVEFNVAPDISKENKGLIVSGNSYYVRAYLLTPIYGAEKPYIKLDIEKASDISAFDYNDLARVATITKNNSFPIIGPTITAW